ncbi:MAG: hypothetical protein NVS3B21_14160 [Acidimicrobiales bacterium]
MSGFSVPDDPVVIVVASAPDGTGAAAGVEVITTICAAGGRAALWIGGEEDPELVEFREEIRTPRQAGAQRGPDPEG